MKLNKIINLVQNMGWRYAFYRAGYELRRRSGLLRNRFPVDPVFRPYVTLEQWKLQPASFFFRDRESVSFPRNPQPELKETFDSIRNGKLLLFNSIPADLGPEYDWVTNPDSGFHYDVKKHWTEIADYSKEAGDIKFVWEKSRFSYLYDIIRYDYHFNDDCAEYVLRDIQSWIKCNPINCGPNYRCSQEMSLRVLNWTFALYYYRNSPHLTSGVFGQIQHVIYWHMHHVYSNINFSRIAVRNNHAVTETLALYLAGLFFPAFPNAASWKRQGKKWFEAEIAYQVYEDGTYLQFSMNYHRVVVQLLTWAVTLSEKNGERFSDVVYDRAKKSLMFLRTCMANEEGWLPNYGANDGALFFKLSSNHYRDYRPQLSALAAALGMDIGLSGPFEDGSWYGADKQVKEKWLPADGGHQFAKGGYYIIREPDALTFIKCGSYKDRPSHADNLHMDVWYKGENILLDAGSYKYNTDAETIRYFSGTGSHNTVMPGDYDQMLKGGRFIWYYWSQCMEARLQDGDDAYYFDGAVRAFRYLKHDIIHKRVVIKYKESPFWEVRDTISGLQAGMTVRQLWHYLPALKSRIRMRAKDGDGREIVQETKTGWYSPLYGQRETTEECYFRDGNRIDTVIMIEDSQ